MSLTSVITTIQAPTACVRKLAAKLKPLKARLLIVGDRKGPSAYPLAGAELVAIEAQRQLPFKLARLLPEGHYVRKNLGYLLAIQDGADCLYETDDDNGPLPHWQPRKRQVRARRVEAKGWFNAYAPFSKEVIWPRGFPLNLITSSLKKDRRRPGRMGEWAAPIQQGLADNSPDVDAVWRLVLDRPFSFDRGDSLYLAPGTWCPFNSQSTWWWPEAFPLLYLPSFCTFRMTDIWRSFVAQRCLWAMGQGVAFHASEVSQARNLHNLQRDFEDEVPGYRENARIIQILDAVPLDAAPDAVGANLLACYQALVAGKIFPAKELRLVKAWLADLRAIDHRLPF